MLSWAILKQIINGLGAVALALASCLPGVLSWPARTVTDPTPSLLLKCRLVCILTPFRKG